MRFGGLLRECYGVEGNDYGRRSFSQGRKLIFFFDFHDFTFVLFLEYLVITCHRGRSSEDIP